MSACEPLGAPRKAAILISSTRAALGIYEDASAPVIADWLQEQNFDVIPAVIVPDGPAVGAIYDGSGYGCWIAPCPGSWRRCAPPGCRRPRWHR